MAAVLPAAKTQQKAQGGKPNGLAMEGQLLMMLGYWWDYRTYFHRRQSYGKSQSQAYRIIKWCADTLARGQAVRLPGRQAVAASERGFDGVLIDAAETLIECPKKTAALPRGQKEAAHADDADRR